MSGNDKTDGERHPWVIQHRLSHSIICHHGDSPHRTPEAPVHAARKVAKASASECMDAGGSLSLRKFLAFNRRSGDIIHFTSSFDVDTFFTSP